MVLGWDIQIATKCWARAVNMLWTASFLIVIANFQVAPTVLGCKTLHSISLRTWLGRFGLVVAKTL